MQICSLSSPGVADVPFINNATGIALDLASIIFINSNIIEKSGMDKLLLYLNINYTAFVVENKLRNISTCILYHHTYYIIP